MRFPEGRMSLDTTMPTSVQRWLGHELEVRGIDAVIYTRYILSILQQDSLDVDYQDVFQPPKKKDAPLMVQKNKARTGKKSEKRRSEEFGSEEKKKSAAVKCLLSVADGDSDIENLIEELCCKLKQQGSSHDADASPVASTTSHNAASVAMSPGDPAEKYYAAFPSLKTGTEPTPDTPSPTTIIPTNQETVWAKKQASTLWSEKVTLQERDGSGCSDSASPPGTEFNQKPQKLSDSEQSLARKQKGKTSQKKSAEGTTEKTSTVKKLKPGSLSGNTQMHRKCNEPGKAQSRYMNSLACKLKKPATNSEEKYNCKEEHKMGQNNHSEHKIAHTPEPGPQRTTRTANAEKPRKFKSPSVENKTRTWPQKRDGKRPHFIVPKFNTSISPAQQYGRGSDSSGDSDFEISTNKLTCRNTEKQQSGKEDTFYEPTAAGNNTPDITDTCNLPIVIHPDENLEHNTSGHEQQDWYTKPLDELISSSPIPSTQRLYNRRQMSHSPDMLYLSQVFSPGSSLRRHTTPELSEQQQEVLFEEGSYMGSDLELVSSSRFLKLFDNNIADRTPSAQESEYDNVFVGSDVEGMSDYDNLGDLTPDSPLRRLCDWVVPVDEQEEEEENLVEDRKEEVSLDQNQNVTWEKTEVYVNVKEEKASDSIQSRTNSSSSSSCGDEDDVNKEENETKIKETANKTETFVEENPAKVDETSKGEQSSIKACTPQMRDELLALAKLWSATPTGLPAEYSLGTWTTSVGLEHIKILYSSDFQPWMPVDCGSTENTDINNSFCHVNLSVYSGISDVWALDDPPTSDIYSSPRPKVAFCNYAEELYINPSNTYNCNNSGQLMDGYLPSQLSPRRPNRPQGVFQLWDVQTFQPRRLWDSCTLTDPLYNYTNIPFGTFSYLNPSQDPFGFSSGLAKFGPEDQAFISGGLYGNSAIYPSSDIWTMGLSGGYQFSSTVSPLLVTPDTDTASSPDDGFHSVLSEPIPDSFRARSLSHDGVFEVFDDNPLFVNPGGLLDHLLVDGHRPLHHVYSESDIDLLKKSGFYHHSNDSSFTVVQPSEKPHHDQNYKKVDAATHVSEVVSKQEKEVEHENLFFSAKTHFRPIQTPKCHSLETASGNCTRNQTPSEDHSDLLGESDGSVGSGYQKYCGVETIDSAGSFVPKFKLLRDNNKSAQTDHTNCDINRTKQMSKMYYNMAGQSESNIETIYTRNGSKSASQDSDDVKVLLSDMERILEFQSPYSDCACGSTCTDPCTETAWNSRISTQIVWSSNVTDIHPSLRNIWAPDRAEDTNISDLSKAENSLGAVSFNNTIGCDLSVIECESADMKLQENTIPLPQDVRWEASKLEEHLISQSLPNRTDTGVCQRKENRENCAILKSNSDVDLITKYWSDSKQTTMHDSLPVDNTKSIWNTGGLPWQPVETDTQHSNLPSSVKDLWDGNDGAQIHKQEALRQEKENEKEIDRDTCPKCTFKRTRRASETVLEKDIDLVDEISKSKACSYVLEHQHPPRESKELEKLKHKHWKDLFDPSEDDVEDKKERKKLIRQNSGVDEEDDDDDVFTENTAEFLAQMFPMEASTAPLPSHAHVLYSSDLEEKWRKSGSQFKVQKPKRIEKTQSGLRRKPCTFFMEGKCRRMDCKYSHDINSITCRFWEEGACFKGITCPFLHGYPSPPSSFDSTSTEPHFLLELLDKSKDTDSQEDEEEDMKQTEETESPSRPQKLFSSSSSEKAQTRNPDRPPDEVTFKHVRSLPITIKTRKK